jgi:hypothetical protein
MMRVFLRFYLQSFGAFVSRFKSRLIPLCVCRLQIEVDSRTSVMERHIAAVRADMHKMMDDMSQFASAVNTNGAQVGDVHVREY